MARANDPTLSETTMFPDVAVQLFESVSVMVYDPEPILARSILEPMFELVLSAQLYVYGSVPPDTDSPVMDPSLLPQVLEAIMSESEFIDGVGKTVIAIVFVSDPQPPASMTDIL